VINHTITHEGQIRMPLEKPVHTDPLTIPLPPYYPDTPIVRNDYARYYDNIADADAQIGQRLLELQADGLQERTVVFIFGDNGRGLPRAKRWLYDSGLHVPLLIRWPGHLQANTATDRLVSFVDFAPTTLSLAGVKIPKHMQGQAFLGRKEKPPRRYVFAARDRMDETYDCIRATRDQRFKYLRNLQPEKPYAQKIEYMDEMPSMKEWRRCCAEGRLTGAQKLFFSPTKPSEELYDTAADPHEVKNLAGDPAYHTELVRLRQTMEQWRRQIHDLSDVAEQQMIDQMWPAGLQPQTAAPKIEPSAGSNKKTVTVKLSCATAGASIVYTLDAVPNDHWLLYTKPIQIDCTATLRCKAIRYGFKESEERMQTYPIK